MRSLIRFHLRYRNKHIIITFNVVAVVVKVQNYSLGVLVVTIELIKKTKIGCVLRTGGVHFKNYVSKKPNFPKMYIIPMKLKQLST